MFNLFTNYLIPIFFINVFLLYLLITLCLIYFIYSSINKRINKNKLNPEYLSLIKDWEFIKFKFNFLKIYYSSVIILIIFLFKNNYLFKIYLDFNSMFNQTNIYFLFSVFTIISILLFLSSNNFLLFIFKIYLNIKHCIQVLSDINFYPIENFNFNPLWLTPKSVLFSQSYNSRSFSTFAKNNNINDFENINLDQDNLEYNSDKSIKKQLKDFKKAYGGGYLGYTHIYNFGNINQFTSYSSKL